MSFFNYRWDKCRLLAIGGTYVYLIEGGTNVAGTNVGGTNVGGRKVAASILGSLAIIVQFKKYPYIRCLKTIGKLIIVNNKQA